MNNSKLQTCPVCEQGVLFLKQGVNTALGEGEGKIPMRFHVCDSCESEVALPEDLTYNKDQMKTFRGYL